MVRIDGLIGSALFLKSEACKIIFKMFIVETFCILKFD